MKSLKLKFCGTENINVRKFKFKLPIVIRLVSLISLLVAAVAFTIAHKNSEFFQSFSQAKEDGVELMQVKTQATQIDVLLEMFIEKTKQFAIDLVAEKQQVVFSPVFTKRFETDADLLKVDIIKDAEHGQGIYATIAKKGLLEKGHEIFELDYTALADVFDGDIKVERFQAKHIKDKDQKKMLKIMLPLVKNDSGEYTHIAVAYLKIERLMRIFSGITSRSVYMSDAAGNLIVHSKGEVQRATDKIRGWELYRKSQQTDLHIQQVTDNLQDHKFNYIQGSFAKSHYGPIVFSETPIDYINGPSIIAKKESFYWLGIILSASFFFVFVFSSTITSPIEKLQELTERVATGDFGVKAQEVISSRDELGELAYAFDNMTQGLAERDKMKNVMNKFHGSAIADTLLEGEVEKGGNRKDCVIYFSDIRGFTDFSERHPAEEVVEMLNDYFEVMVGIIIKHGGVVDKFIGDAIMAVWGAPNSTGTEAEDALTASIEMRRALVDFNNDRIARGKEPIKVGMGLHKGSVISGTIGSSERVEYTVIGDNVNMAARIEASTKSFGADILLSEELARAVHEHVIIKQAGSVEVKGKVEPLKLFTVHGYRNADGTFELVETPYSSYEKGEDAKVKVA